MRDFILNLLLVGLRNLIVLAIDTAQIAIPEENISRAARARERRLFAKMWRVRRNNGQTARITGRNFIV